MRGSFTFLTPEEGEDKGRDQLFAGSLLHLCICHLSNIYILSYFGQAIIFFSVRIRP